MWTLPSRPRFTGPVPERRIEVSPPSEETQQKSDQQRSFLKKQYAQLRSRRETDLFHKSQALQKTVHYFITFLSQLNGFFCSTRLGPD